MVCNIAESLLLSLSYKVKRIKISDYLKRLASEKYIKDCPDLDNLSHTEKYPRLQEAGNKLRQKLGSDILAELAITQIATFRTAKIPDKVELKDYVPDRVVYLIDQLKNPEEINLLRKVYGNLFFLVGVFSSTDQRKSNLWKYLTETQATKIMEKDRKESVVHGQQLDKTLKLADLFVRNSNAQDDKIREQIHRFLNLLHGQIGITPTQHETAMHAAFSAGLSSACLSRQVGASITDKEGNLISTGCNDVPKAGGGLYTSDREPDNRCYNIHGGICSNDQQKLIIRDKIKEILSLEPTIKSEVAEKLANAIKEKTELKDLLEFSRSVHAEMDALISVARVGGKSILNGYLYTTTFPCHNCARHIVAAGISKIFYIEPYEKSFAKDLHRDALDSDSENDEAQSERVKLLHFEGIAPIKFKEFFIYRRERKKLDGSLDQTNVSEGQKIVAELLDNYREVESQISTYLTSTKEIPDSIFQPG